MTPSRALRLAAAVLAALAALAGAWIVAGNAYAARREREAAQLLEKTFGPRAPLVAEYAAEATNAEARNAERLARAVGYDLSPTARRYDLSSTVRGSQGDEMGFSNSDRQAIADYVTAQLARPDDSVSAPPPDVSTPLDRHRPALAAFEESLVSAPPPRWVCQPEGADGKPLIPNLLGHMQIQRLLVAHALAAVAQGDRAAAGRILNASWSLNEGLATRPELLSQLIAIAVARLEVGALRKVSASPEAWGRRLAAMGRRESLVGALVLEHGDPRTFSRRIRANLARVNGGGRSALAWFREPSERVWSAEYTKGWTRAIALLRGEAAFEVPKGDAENPTTEPAATDVFGRPTEIILAIAIPGIRSSFDRADRLALDAELTGKVLQVKAARAATGAWPPPSADLAASRFPGLAWKYSVDAGAMTIALNRELPKPAAGLVLPTSFSSRALAP